ncbi:MAG: TraR/DksA C4-type zinc finger protein [Kofleriaceae bacterium]|jgi:DnaK suppressor protein|nr:TraR/DksA C4-type zinc finger protein [Kofleriaceae bacterium]MBP9172402.1 TraR/DksA C4-type zinc finger protein [Kofleriaceae bacterium]MBP9861422.1 TraR/DksA C4-type zinc finger protein [Kofleriaceae bacterium]
MLTPSQSDELRRQLESELGRLVANAQHAIGFTMDRDRDRIGRDSIDESVEEELYSTQLRLHDRETFLIVKIQDALKRLDAGEIDDCEECSEPIGFRRLMARPMTTLCVDCKTAREQVEAEDTGE